MNIVKISDFSQFDYSEVIETQVISFDFFDTLVYRHCDEIQLIKRTFEHIKKQFNLFYSVDEFLQSKARFESNYTRSSKGAVYSIEQIYREVFDDLDKLECSVAFYQMLIEIESSNFSLSNGVIQLLKSLKASGKRIIISSDTYYNRADFYQFIEKLGIDIYIDELYLSCEYKESKSDGALFDRVLYMENICGKSVLHIGDNAFSDVTNAHNKGINAVHYELSPSAILKREVGFFATRLLAPVLSVFCQSIYSKLPQNAQVVFLGRDGFLPFQVFNKLYPSFNSASYCYLNRVIAHQLRFERLDSDFINYIATQYKAEGIWGVVSVIGLENTKFSDSISNFIEEGEYEKCTFINTKIAEDIVANNELVLAFYESLKARRLNAVEYLRQYGFYDNDKPTVIVDIGWNASIYKMLLKSNIQVEQCHLLVSTISKMEGVISLISFDNEYANNAQQYVAMRELLEHCFSEAKGSIRYINNQLLPEFSPFESQKEQQLIHEFVLRGLDDISITESLEPIRTLGRYLSELPLTFSSYFTDIVSEVFISSNRGISFKNFLPTQSSQTQVLIKDKQANIYRFLQWMKSLSDKFVVIYGAGSGAEFLLPFINSECAWIVDINSKIWGQELCGKEIKGLESLVGHTPTIVVSVLGRKDQILSALSSYNLNIEFLEDNF